MVGGGGGGGAVSRIKVRFRSTTLGKNEYSLCIIFVVGRTSETLPSCRFRGLRLAEGKKATPL